MPRERNRGVSPGQLTGTWIRPCTWGNAKRTVVISTEC
nr:hypothetical protein [Kibdelosporangium sp. MJ126-NF4]